MMDRTPLSASERTIALHTLIDRAEQRLRAIGGKLQTVNGSEDFPVRHIFTPGLYVREITMPANSIITSKIHKTEHPFVVSKGRCLVLTEEGWTEIRAPHTGITKPGTRRLLVIRDETIWTTFHPTQQTTVEGVEEEIIEKRPNPFLEEVQ